MLESKAPIIPVFFGVKRADLRWTEGKNGIYAKALEILANKQTRKGKRYGSNIIEKWRNALSQVSDNSGFELEVLDGKKMELKLLNEVVQCLLKMVKMQKPDIYVTEYPTGLDEELENFEKTVLLPQQQSGKPQILGIVGLGGVGKTTFAKQFFNKKKSGYLKSCFLFEIKENKSSLNSLQSQLLKSLTGKNEQVNSVDEGKGMLIKPLQSFKALIILDDVDHVDQVRAFLTDVHDLHSKSSVLITSRDTGVLISVGVEKSSVYMLGVLNKQNSRQLFCSHAFRSQRPLPGSEPLINQFLEACNGLPLSLKVLGAYLYTVEISEWEAELGRLPTEVKERVRTSYDALDKEELQIFLDIACFFKGQNMDTAISIWQGSGWNGKRAFRNLHKRCLVEVDSSNVIQMHEHLRDLGREIAEKLSPFRLWRWTDGVIDHLLQQSSNDQILTVRALKMDLSEYNKDSEDVLRRIRTTQLQILDIEDVVWKSIFGTESPDMAPKISWFRWRKCPYTSLPSWIPVKNLRHLECWKVIPTAHTVRHRRSPPDHSNHSKQKTTMVSPLQLSACVVFRRCPASSFTVRHVH